MSQEVENIQPSYPLFRNDEYKESLANKREAYEERHPQEKIDEVFQWTTTKEYQELNFNREALTVNPAKACQPLGAVLCAWVLKKPCLMSMVHKVASLISVPISTVISKSLLPAYPIP